MVETWADVLGAACEQAFETRPNHPGTVWALDRGVPPVSGVGVGALPDILPGDLTYPDSFMRWATRVKWTESFILIIRDWSGRVVGFQARDVTQKGYETYPVYDIHISPLMWGADRAAKTVWQSRRLVLVEGCLDALACYLGGGEDIVATLMARPSKSALKWIDRLADHVICFYDMDEPGRDGCERVRRAFPNKLVTAPKYAAHDPWDLWKTRPQFLGILKPLTKI